MGQILSISVIVLLSVLTLTFFYLYIGLCGSFVYRNRLLISIPVTAIVAVLTSVAVIFQIKDKTFVYRLCMLVMLCASIVMLILYLLKLSGFWEKVDSVQDLREYISSYGSFAVVAFILLQILQVVILPVPGVMAIGAGTALFGPLQGAVYSLIGIMCGSLIAFFIGRVLGYKATKWLVGDGLDKTLKQVEGKDKIILSFMFLFPFFPDDVLCFVAGMSSMSWKYFLIMITIARVISTFFTSFSVSGSLIPYDTWWGILIWAVIFIATVSVALIIYKRGDKIEKYIVEKFRKKG